MNELISGNLNSVSVVKEENNRLLILRKPHSKAIVDITMAQVRSEHLAEGFLENPLNRVELRTFEEQITLAQRLRLIDVPTPITYLNSKGEQLLDYIPETEKLFDLWLKQDPKAPYATPEAFRALMIAHEGKLVLGDRTGKNELVTPDAKVILIDFDIRLSGPEAREFDFVTLIYRLSRAAHRGSVTQLPILGEIYAEILSSPQARILYNQITVLNYMHRFVELSSEKGNHRLKGMTPLTQPEYSEELFLFLIDVLKSIRK